MAGIPRQAPRPGLDPQAVLCRTRHRDATHSTAGPKQIEHHAAPPWLLPVDMCYAPNSVEDAHSYSQPYEEQDRAYHRRKYVHRAKHGVLAPFAIVAQAGIRP